MARRYVGIDLAKKSMEVCILEEGVITRHGMKTDRAGRRRLLRILRKTDTVGMELDGTKFRLLRGKADAGDK
jgi:hypothetical protein